MAPKPKYPDISPLCDSISRGATLQEACLEHGIGYDAARFWMFKGRSGKPGDLPYDNRARILDAMATYRQITIDAIHDAAKKGAPRALDEMLRRVETDQGDANHETPPTDDLARARWLLAMDYRKLSSYEGIAYTNLRNLIRQTEAEIVILARKGHAPTPEELPEALKADLPKWTIEHLNLAIDEAIRRGILQS